MYLDLVVGCLSEVKRSLVLNSFNCYCFEKNIRYYNYGSLRLFWCNWRMKSHSATEKTSSWDVWRANGDACWHHLIKATVTITHIIFTAMLAYDVSGKSASSQQAEGKPVTTEFSFASRNKRWSLPALTVHFDFHVKDKLLISFPVAYGKKVNGRTKTMVNNASYSLQCIKDQLNQTYHKYTVNSILKDTSIRQIPP